MKTTIGVYDLYVNATNAVEKIKEGGFPAKQISLITKADNTNEHMHLTEAELSIGVVAGPVLGVLTGIGLFAIPGFGFLFGAGAIVGALAGFDIGLIGGGIVSILTRLGINIKNHDKYQNHLNKGNYLVIVQGTLDEVNLAHKIIETNGKHIEVNKH